METALTFQAVQVVAALCNPILLKAEGQVPYSRSQETLAVSVFENQGVIEPGNVGLRQLSWVWAS